MIIATTGAWGATGRGVFDELSEKVRKRVVLWSMTWSGRELKALLATADIFSSWLLSSWLGAGICSPQFQIRPPPFPFHPKLSRAALAAPEGKHV